jgi:hypothetical protein
VELIHTANCTSKFVISQTFYDKDNGVSPSVKKDDNYQRECILQEGCSKRMKCIQRTHGQQRCLCSKAFVEKGALDISVQRRLFLSPVARAEVVMQVEVDVDRAKAGGGEGEVDRAGEGSKDKQESYFWTRVRILTITRSAFR